MDEPHGERETEREREREGRKQGREFAGEERTGGVEREQKKGINCQMDWMGWENGGWRWKRMASFVVLLLRGERERESRDGERFSRHVG